MYKDTIFILKSYPFRESKTVAWTLSTSANNSVKYKVSKLPDTIRFGPRTCKLISSKLYKYQMSHSQWHHLLPRTVFLQPNQTPVKKDYVWNRKRAHDHLHSVLNRSCTVSLDLLQQTNRPDQCSYHMQHLVHNDKRYEYYVWYIVTSLTTSSGVCFACSPLQVWKGSSSGKVHTHFRIAHACPAAWLSYLELVAASQASSSETCKHTCTDTYKNINTRNTLTCTVG